MADKNTNIPFQPKPTQARFIDLQGQRFERLVVLGFVGRNSRNCALWLCQCDCGNKTILTIGDLRHSVKPTRSCGCLQKERAATSGKKNITHGLSDSRVFSIWMGMKRRCYYHNDKAFERYGGRGITVCERWLDSFENFFEDTGEPPSNEHTIDRMNVNGNYTPENCRWATNEEQANNKRTSDLLTFNGKTQSLTLWARELHIKTITLRTRIHRLGWSVEKALTTSVSQAGTKQVLKNP